MAVPFPAFSLVVPTRVGVNRSDKYAAISAPRCPHARGGEPAQKEEKKFEKKLSPRAWG